MCSRGQGSSSALLNSRLGLGRLGILSKRFGLSSDTWSRIGGRIGVILKRLWSFFGPSIGRLGAFLDRVESVKGRLEVGHLGLHWGRLRHVLKRLESSWRRIGASWCGVPKAFSAAWGAYWGV